MEEKENQEEIDIVRLREVIEDYNLTPKCFEGFNLENEMESSLIDIYDDCGGTVYKFMYHDTDDYDNYFYLIDTDSNSRIVKDY